MDVASELIALLERFAQRAPLPRVRALHLPPAAAMNSKAGEFCAIELDDDSLGLSFVLLDASSRGLVIGGVGPNADVQGADALALARWFTQPQGARRAIGWAAVNALTRCLFERAGFVPPPSGDSIGMLDPAPGDHVGMIGLFPPLVKQILGSGAQLTAVELRPDLAGQRDGYRVTLDRGELAGCNKVIATSTMLLNDSLDATLSACSRASRIAVIGPGAGCLPDPLFARGVTLMGGTWITDRTLFCESLAAGDSWTAAARKFALHRDEYPGFDALLDRVRT